MKCRLEFLRSVCQREGESLPSHVDFECEEHEFLRRSEDVFSEKTGWKREVIHAFMMSNGGRPKKLAAVCLRFHIGGADYSSVIAAYVEEL